jgi:hypothetical protein
MVSERQRTNIVPNKQTSHIYLIIKSIQKTHIFIEELLSVYHFHILWKRYTDFLQLPPAGFSPGASCICISIKKKAISERYTIKTASRLLQNDIATVEHKDRSSYKME